MCFNSIFYLIYCLILIIYGSLCSIAYCENSIKFVNASDNNVNFNNQIKFDSNDVNFINIFDHFSVNKHDNIDKNKNVRMSINQYYDNNNNVMRDKQANKLNMNSQLFDALSTSTVIPSSSSSSISMMPTNLSWEQSSKESISSKLNINANDKEQHKLLSNSTNISHKLNCKWLNNIIISNTSSSQKINKLKNSIKLQRKCKQKFNQIQINNVNRHKWHINEHKKSQNVNNKNVSTLLHEKSTVEFSEFDYVNNDTFDEPETFSLNNTNGSM